MSEENLTKTSVGDDPSMNGSEDSVLKQSSAGHLLRTVREAKGISISEVAIALKLSPRQIVAMEADEWSSFPRTIIRGFVRNYARYLGQDAAPLLEALDRLSLPIAPELEVKIGIPVALQKEGGTDKRDYAWVVSGVVILVLAALMYFFMPTAWWQSGLETLKNFIRVGKGDESAAVILQPQVAPVTDILPAIEASQVIIAPEIPIPVAAPQEVQADAVNNSAIQVTNEASQSLEPLLDAVSSVPVASSEPPVLREQAKLLFSFTQPSWVEVRDHSGQIVFSNESPAQSQREVGGRPPFSIVIGNASHVALQYNGKLVDLSKRSKDGVARLTLE